ncbi:diguanylate cyclase (GGDEF)-like protein [Acidovorax delafieldii]|uniref:Diguanylate cyclase (GGDEF)-like protein n=1 Tax=Acidovorax delafieldii TaxID=47920 RepID=A0A561XXD7_ACIDE|nr:MULTISPECIES: GGDEF domain-containing protein [Acidovorax]PIF17240.1 diguanylate cyclase (GGDEF)-like protein [Acidovorax sp. 59]PKW03735.1 diguanylate cyclase (GGDEF)-like protein [Acidovorax sp. 30]RMA62782.1 diguanylate cyclase (GGDEF)-like protein [Acidovorax sp. 100]TWG40777.1 diguanylate cyclase (GGDEF)-like protein [Acidovorax delafieldii]
MARVKWSIALRLGALLASFSVFAAILAGYYTFDSSRERLQGRAERSLLATTQVLARHMQAGFGTVARDTAFLADAAAVEQDQGRLADLFKANLQAHPAYLQIRFISASDYGLELVRIDRQGDKLVRVPDDQLQEKSHFPFVFEALSLPDGEVYVSEFGINHEDAAQEAAVPVFNMASPVVQGGQLRGVVVVRVAAAPFLHNFNAALPTPYGFYLSNRWGDFLVHPDAAQTFGFDRGQRILIQESFPQVAALVDGRAEEAVLSQSGTDDEEARVFAFVRMPFGNADEGRFMVVGLSQPLAVVQGEVLDLGRSILKILLVLSVVGVALAAGVSRLVTQPLQAMVKAAQAFSRGEAHGALPVHRGDEVGELARSFQDMEQQISRQLAELNLSRDAMAHLAHHDALTGLPNRRMFEQRLAQVLELSRRSGRSCALLFVDLDEFKAINDTRGHAVGDLVLQAVARTIVGAVRQVDTVARLAGDEFTVLCENVDSEEAALQIVTKLQHAFEPPLDIDGEPLAVRASIGLSLFPRDAQDARTLMASADAAMYRIKQSHKRRL